jgi:AraC-like DNA-binding protein
VKKHCAIELVEQDQLTQTELTEHLGYADESAFSKLFRRWTGMGIREFRRQL